MENEMCVNKTADGEWNVCKQNGWWRNKKYPLLHFVYERENLLNIAFNFLNDFPNISGFKATVTNERYFGSLYWKQNKN